MMKLSERVCARFAGFALSAAARPSRLLACVYRRASLVLLAATVCVCLRARPTDSLAAPIVNAYGRGHKRRRERGWLDRAKGGTHSCCCAAETRRRLESACASRLFFRTRLGNSELKRRPATWLACQLETQEQQQRRAEQD